MMALAWLWCAIASAFSTDELAVRVDDAQEVLVSAQKLYARLCAPEALADAQSELDFARIELAEGYPRRANDHLERAEHYADVALRISIPCGSADGDADTIPDVVDQCSSEAEDLDGDRDEDGCRDIDPYGDEDGDGIINANDLCIDEPEDHDGDADDDGCPEISDDTDADGIIDAVDGCVDEPEDIDGFDDEDGCPDPDNDGDGVLDADDLCPDELETVNDYLDEDGCPDNAPTGVKITRTRVEIDDTIQFHSGSAKLLDVSFEVLDTVVQVLQDAIYLDVRIEGHTDSQGGDAWNLTLSQRRAESVLAYFVEQGVDEVRLTAVGYGEERPVDTNRTSTGRARNRRVEFHIVRDE